MKKLQILLVFMALILWTGSSWAQNIFFDGFESGNTDQTAVAGWTQESVSGTGVWTANTSLTTYNRTSRTGLWNAYLKYGNTRWMFKSVTLTASTQYVLSFYARQDATSGANILASYGTTGDVAGMTNSIIASTVVTNGEYQNFSGTFTPATTGTYFIGIRADENYAPYYVSIDDISLDVNTLPSLIAVPSSLDFGSILSGSTSAEQSYALSGINLTAGPIVVTAPTGYGVSLTTGGPYTSSVTVAYTAPTLASTSIFAQFAPTTSNTMYNGDITNIGGGASTPVALTGSSPCDAITSFPYTEGFDDAWVGDPAAPECWAVIDNNADGDKWIQNTSSTYVHSGTGSAKLYTDYNAANDDWLITPPLDLGTTTDYRLKFWTRAASTSEVDELQVLLSTTDANIASFTTTVMPSTTIDFTTFAEYILDLSAYTNTVYIAFVRNQSPADGWNLYLDDVTIEAIPACPAPTVLTAGTITATSASLGWTENGTATSWNIELGAAGFTPIGTPTQSGVTNPYTYSGLTDATSYDWYVQADCGSRETSAWTGPNTFSTLCNTFTVPFTEDFTGTQNCWTVLDENVDSDAWNMDYTTNYNSSPEVAMMYTDYNSGANDDYLITPQITLTGNERLRYWYRVQSSGEPNDFEVLLSTTGKTAADFDSTLMVNTSFSNTTYAENSIDISAYSGNVYIAFHVPSGGLDGYKLFIDDVVVEEIPSCFNPTGQVVTNVTQTSADLAWVEINPTPAILWNVEWGITGFVQGAGTTVTGINDTIYTLSGLSAGTGYQWYVQANCGTTSTWTGPHSFATLVANDICSDAIAIGNVTDQPFDNTTATTSGFNGNPHDINQDIFYVYTAVASGYLDVDLCLDPDTGGFDTKLAIYDDCVPTTELAYDDDGCPTITRSLKSQILDMPVVSGEDYIIQVGAYSTNSGTGDITISLDSCVPADSVVTENILQTTADLVWYNHGEATTWEVIIDTAGFAFDVNDTPTYSGVSSPYGVIGLLADTDYEWYIMPTCGDTLDWVGPIAFTTLASCPYPTVQTTTNVGPAQADLGWTEMGTATTWEIEIDTLGATFDGTPDHSVTLNPYTVTGLLNEQTYQWYVRADCGTDAESEWVGPISFTTLVACPAPTNPVTSAITAAGATLNWAEGWSEAYWLVEWDTTGFALGTGNAVTISSHPTTLTGLTPNTTYQWYVQADCNGPFTPGDESLWVGPITFTTLCLSFTAPFTEAFEDAFVPDCWAMSGPENWRFNTSAGYGAAPAGDHTSGGGTNYAWVDGSGSGSDTGITLSTPFIDVSGLTTPMLEFYLFSNNANTPGDNNTLTVDFWDGDSWNAGIYTWTGDAPDWFIVRLDLSTYSITGDVQFNFIVDEVAATAYYNDILIDDVVVDEFPSCPSPSDLTTGTITDNSAIISWTPGGIETNWNVEWGPAGFTQGTGTIIANTTNPDTLTGLASATLYQWYVQADCDGGVREESVWIGPITFSTTGAGTCDHYVILIDSYGDGWNGGTLDVYRNGFLALSGLTIASGAGPDSTLVTSNSGDELIFDYTAGSYGYENEYYVYRITDDALLIAQGAYSVEPIDTIIDYACPPATLAIAPSLYDFGNVPIGTTISTVFNLYNIGMGTVTVNSAADITLTGDAAISIVGITASNEYPVTLPSDTLLVEVQLVSAAAVSYSATLSANWGTARAVTDAVITAEGCPAVANDDCEDAIAISGPYPTTLASGSNECTAVDCPGVLDWFTIWYEIDLPYAMQDIYITQCGDGVDMASVGVVLMDDCACDDYILYTSATWGDSCGTGYQGAEVFYNDVEGPTTLLWPAYAIDALDNNVAFNYSVDILPVDFTPTAPASAGIVVDDVAGEVVVSWDYVAGLKYTVYSDTDPYGIFATVEGTEITTGSLTVSGIPAVNTFYRVTADVLLVRGVNPAQTYTDPTLHRLTEKGPQVIIGTTRGTAEREESSNRTRK